MTEEIQVEPQFLVRSLEETLRAAQSNNVLIRALVHQQQSQITLQQEVIQEQLGKIAAFEEPATSSQCSPEP